MSTDAVTAPVVTEAPAVAPDTTTTTTAETPTPVDAATAEVTADPAVADNGSRDTRALARIARERTALRAEQAALAADRAQLAQVREVLAEYQQNPKAIEKLLGADVLERLAAAYVPAETPKVATAEDQIAELRAELKARDQAISEQQNKQVIDNGINALKASLEREGDTYELIRETGSHEFVFNVLVRAKNEGHEITLKDAADAVESVLENEHGSELDKFLKIKKFQSKFAQQKVANTATATATSLTSLSTRSTAPAPDPARKQSRQEILAEAIAMLNA